MLPYEYGLGLALAEHPDMAEGVAGGGWLVLLAVAIVAGFVMLVKE